MIFPFQFLFERPLPGLFKTVDAEVLVNYLREVLFANRLDVRFVVLFGIGFALFEKFEELDVVPGVPTWVPFLRWLR